MPHRHIDKVNFMIKKMSWRMNGAVLGLFVLITTHLVAKETEFYSTDATITNQWADPTLPDKKPLTYGLGYADGYQEGFTTGYNEGYKNGSKASEMAQVLANKNADDSEYFQGISEGFRKGYTDGLEKGREDHNRCVEKRWKPEGQKQVRIWKFQWGYFGAYWNLSEIRNVSRG